MRKPRLAIVSTYGSMCGIAAYTHFLSQQISEDFDIEIVPLNQDLLRSTHPRVRRVADRHILSIAARLKDFDFVNLQFEHGTLGSLPRDIYRRFKILVISAPAISVTFHTIISNEHSQYQTLRMLLKGKIRNAYNNFRQLRSMRLLSDTLIHVLTTEQRRKPVSIIVHTLREKSVMENAYGLSNVYDHPLSFLMPNQVKSFRTQASRDHFSTLAQLPADAKLIGVFGFISRYKNAAMVIQTLRLLPSNYHLLIFGAVHPNEIKTFTEIDAYLAEVLREIGAGLSDLQRAMDVKGSGALSLNLSSALCDLVAPTPGNLFSRVHFMGAMDDTKFLEGMCICDSVVLPYSEVGQTSSGPIAQALELGCRIVASRNLVFLEYARYHPDAIEFFDIGNFVELAQRLVSPPQYDNHARVLDWKADTNRQVYCRANRATIADPEYARSAPRVPVPSHRSAE